MDIEERGKCNICGKVFEFAELEEHDGCCYDCYKSQQWEDDMEQKARESEGR